MLYGRGYRFADNEAGPWGELHLNEQIRRSRLRPFAEVARDHLADANMTLTIGPPKPIVIPYDEMRAILGLPDVKAEVEWARTCSGLCRIAQSFEEFSRTIGAAFAPVTAALTEFTDALSQPHVPPMWANDPTRTRRRRNR
ncbi:hypothetical protein [Rhodococcus sp. NPDC127528]|uniref:hypothetical protein n=1 Tax=unclassified Rhodococcus (in: high G+C Gram-positive bacteria) TaxID=192944 RepID=UPI00362B32AA